MVRMKNLKVNNEGALIFGNMDSPPTAVTGGLYLTQMELSSHGTRIMYICIIKFKIIQKWLEWKKVIVSGSAADLASLSLDTALPVGSGGTGASTLTDGGNFIRKRNRSHYSSGSSYKWSVSNRFYRCRSCIRNSYGWF